MLRVERLEPRWQGQCVIVAATGPSLTPEVAEACRGDLIIAVNDAYKLLPFADVLYACDAAWWDVHKGASGFPGEKWSSHRAGGNDKTQQQQRYGLRLVAGDGKPFFSTDPALIHYGGNSGFQAVNLAIHFGAARIVLVGFDMRDVKGKRHFFGDHPKGLRTSTAYTSFIRSFENAAKKLAPGVEIVNATPGSALKCFPFIDFGVPLKMAA